jgi:hypothetical protein
MQIIFEVVLLMSTELSNSTRAAHSSNSYPNIVDIRNTTTKIIINYSHITTKYSTIMHNSLFFRNTILFLFVIDTHYEKQLITLLGYFKFFRPPHCLQQTHENETIVTIQGDLRGIMSPME